MHFPRPVSLDPSLRLIGPPLTGTWTVGQILQATVVGRTGADTFLLRAGGNAFEARSALTLSPGQMLQLQVAPRGDSGATVLRVLPSPAQEPALAQALRQALPRHTDIAPVLQRLMTDLDAPAAEGESHAGPRALIAKIMAALPDTHTLTEPETLRRAVANSGTLLEARLARATACDPQLLAQDLKANLLRLAAQLKGGSASPLDPGHAPGATAGLPDAPPQPAGARDLAPHVDGALARIQINQLASLPAEHGAPPALVVEIPLRQGEQLHSLRLRFERDRNAPSSDAEAQPWSVLIELDPPGLGPIRARVTAQARDVSAAFWTEQAQTAALLRDNLATLEHRLQREGLRCRELACHVGSGPELVAAGVQAPAGLLDERA